ncbi:MAG: hemerythrin [Aquabacterium sp.]|jgi:hemerythrin-like metal-binding protein|uniref:hemerythrin n=1 Tax=Aquabacterium sp. TaxID=1872578 RepID=UPI001B76CE4F|nr:hemerythrin [Aquabacterium sp.]MBP7132157.1 hemerythrin [Aquabacterium sp.]MBP9063074.1 hemerythrin [Aquabacterium sp.]MDQ5925668.1 hypothetical protein [Pseudomonadota bacterium]
MTTFVWSDDMSVHMRELDDLHAGCVTLLNNVLHADDATLLDTWQAFIAHTEAHFHLEDRWMQMTGFAPDNCHSSQHAMVLGIMKDGAQEGDLRVVRQMAHEMTVWLPHHIDAMDAGLVEHFKEVGFDPVTEQVTKPEALPQYVVSSCSVDPCSEHA